jgi:hypothetical protein
MPKLYTSAFSVYRSPRIISGGVRNGVNVLKHSSKADFSRLKP